MFTGLTNKNHEMSIIQSNRAVNLTASPKEKSTTYSPEILAANARLQQLRNRRCSVQTPPLSKNIPAQTTSTADLDPSPWFAPLTKRLSTSDSSPQALEPETQEEQPNTTVKLSASIGLAMLQEDCSAEGRIWLFCHHLDKNRRGWLDIEMLREQLATKGSPLRICGWRQLRKLLQCGIGRFWTRDAQGRLWLKGAAHVASFLGLETVRSQAIQLPIKALKNIQTFRAYSYACFFHLRRSDNPISRIALTSLTGVNERTQLIYERIAGIDSTRCIAIGNRYTNEEWQEQAWHRQNKTFIFVDHQGQQGRAGEKYVAWHLPNRYQSNIETAGFGRKRRINQQLRDKLILVNHQGRGNQFGVMQQKVNTMSVFYQDGSKAVKAIRRTKAEEIYWEQQRTNTCVLWNPLGGIR